MLKFFDGLLGSLFRFILFLPFIALGTVFVLLSFIDTLLEGKPFSAIGALILSPFKAIAFFLTFSLSVASEGWKIGVAQLLSSAVTRTTHFFSFELFTNPDFFLASVTGADSVALIFDGDYFGFLARKMASLTFSYMWFVEYKNYADSPHNPANTMGIQQAYQSLQAKYEENIDENEDYIKNEIEAFLQQGIDDEDAGDEQREYAEAAMRCFRRFQKNDEDDLENKAPDLDKVPSPLRALYLVWVALKTELEPAKATQGKALLASYLSHLQRGLNRMHDYVDTGADEDEPECPTGSVAILLDVLSMMIPDVAEYAQTPTKIDRVDAFKRILDEKLNRNYSLGNSVVKKHYSGPLAEQMIEDKAKNFTKTQTKHLRDYAHFLFYKQNVPVGGKEDDKAALTLEDVDALVEATLDAWKPNK